MYKRPVILLTAIILSGAFCTAEPSGNLLYAMSSSQYPAPAFHPRKLFLGTYNSPKGFGPNVSIWTRDDIIHSFSVLADLGGVATGDMNSPGWVLEWTANHLLVKGEIPSEPLNYSLYMGHGFTVGHVRDFDRIGKGWMGSICLDSGLAAHFRNRLTICFEFSMEIGLILTGGGEVISLEPSGRSLGVYRNGVYRSYLPQIKLLYEL